MRGKTDMVRYSIRCYESQANEMARYTGDTIVSKDDRQDCGWDMPQYDTYKFTFTGKWPVSRRWLSFNVKEFHIIERWVE
jgi:hypothetical protein